MVSVGGAEHTLGLHNLFHETRELDFEARAALMNRFVRAMLAPRESLDDWEDAADRLLPVLRAATMFASIKEAASSPVMRAFAPHLVEVLALDTPETTQILLHHVVERWGRPLDELFARAYQNLAAVPTSLEAHDPHAPYPLLRVANDDNYDSSRLLLPGWLAQLAGPLNGRPIAGVPERGTLLVAGDGDPAGVARILEATMRQYRSSARSISPALYTVDDAGKVVPWRPAREHPARLDVEEAHVVLGLREYESTKEQVQAAVGEDLYVASFTAMRSETDVWSYCAWTRGVPSLLPRTDRIVLIDLEGDRSKPTELAWEDVAGSLTEVPDQAPPRYRTGDWPLGARAT